MVDSCIYPSWKLATFTALCALGFGVLAHACLFFTGICGFFDFDWFTLHVGQTSFFPRASERRVLPIVGVCISSSHFLIFTFSHLRTFSSSHLLLFTSSHLHIFSSSHFLLFTSSHLRIFSSSHFLIFTSSRLHTFSSSHLLIFTSSHLHIFSSSHLFIFTSSHLHIFSSSHPHIFTFSHLHIFSSSHLLIFTPSHLHIFSSSHLLTSTSSHLHIFSSSHPHIFTSSHLHIFSSCPLALLPSHPSCPLLLFYFSSEGGGRGRDGAKRNPFAQNDVRSPKTEVKLRFQLVRRNPFDETRFDHQKLR